MYSYSLSLSQKKKTCLPIVPSSSSCLPKYKKKVWENNKNKFWVFCPSISSPEVLQRMTGLHIGGAKKKQKRRTDGSIGSAPIRRKKIQGHTFWYEGGGRSLIVSSKFKLGNLFSSIHEGLVHIYTAAEIPVTIERFRCKRFS